MRDIMALCKVYMINIMSNKFAFVYNLLLPIIYFIYKNVNLSSATNHFNTNTAEALGNFWAYIILKDIACLFLCRLPKNFLIVYNKTYCYYILRRT